MQNYVGRWDTWPHSWRRWTIQSKRNLSSWCWAKVLETARGHRLESLSPCCWSTSIAHASLSHRVSCMRIFLNRARGWLGKRARTTHSSLSRTLKRQTRAESGKNFNGSSGECWWCGKSCHIKPEWFKWKRDKAKDDADDDDDKNYHEFVAYEGSDKPPKDWALTVCHKAFINYGATVHLMKDKSQITGKTVPSDIKIGSTDRDKVSTTVRGESVAKYSDGD